MNFARLFLPVCTLAFLAVDSAAFAQFNSGGLMSNITARRFGLKRAWYTQVELDRAFTRLTGMTMHVSSTHNYSVFQVVHEDGVEDFSERDLDKFGKPLGKEGAEKKADVLVQQLRDRGKEAKKDTLVIPEITLYGTTDHGMIHAIDGETGRTRWAVPVGRPNHPNTQAGANDAYVAVVNGSILYVLDAESGKLAWDRQLRGVPGAGPGVTDALIHVPTVTGMVETYDLEDSRRPPWYFQSIGRALIQPTITPASVAWPTDRGHLYVGHANKRGSRYRLVAQDTIVAPATFFPPNLLLVASIDGYVYCVHEFNGGVLWRYSTGESIIHQPIVVGQDVYIVTEHAGMIQVDLDSGQEKWWTPRVTRFLAASKDRAYCVDDLNRMVIVDAKTGGQIATIRDTVPDMSLINWQTDRIYLVTKTGLIQCLQEEPNKWPVVHGGPGTEEKKKPEVQQGEIAEPAAEPAPKPAAADPFGGDPFGGGSGGGGGGDPFGGDPFGGGAAADDAGGADDSMDADDPFGADPFAF